MNYMPEVAKLLGLELGEKFKINSAGDISSDEYYIDEISIHEVCDGRVNDYCYPLLIALLNGTDTVIKLPKPILDDVEKRYLAGVIRPFRNRIEYFTKCMDVKIAGTEYLRVQLNSTDYMIFPDFVEDTMYKGMKLDKKYSLKELGL